MSSKLKVLHKIFMFIKAKLIPLDWLWLEGSPSDEIFDQMCKATNLK